jgi:hypothetical protein
VLVHTVIVAGYRPRPHIYASSNLGVAQVGQMIRL